MDLGESQLVKYFAPKVNDSPKSRKIRTSKSSKRTLLPPISLTPPKNVTLTIYYTIIGITDKIIFLFVGIHLFVHSLCKREKSMECHGKTEKLVSTHRLTEKLDNPSIRIIEVSDMKNPKAYFEGHIPGAIYWPWKETLWDPTMREFISPKAFSNLMEKSGIAHETTIIFYSNACQFAHYAFWVCTMRGHSKAKILHGNRTLWIKEKRPMKTDIPKIKATSYPIRSIDESSRIRRDEILAGLNNLDRILLDVRTPEEFMGERVSPKWTEFDYGAEKKRSHPGC